VLTLWRGTGKSSEPAVSTAGTPTRGQDVPQEVERVSVWWYIMLVALAAALAESWLAGRYLGTRREES
jgi:hypothetical protein